MNDLDLNDDPCINYHGGNAESVAAHESIIPLKEILCERIAKYVRACGIIGATCDEIEQELGLSHQTTSARCTEMLAVGRLIRTPAKRKTRSLRNAAVLIHSLELK